MSRRCEASIRGSRNSDHAKDHSGAVYAFSRFAADVKPWCVWDRDLKELTTTFIKTFDATYFDYLVDLHVQQLKAIMFSTPRPQSDDLLPCHGDTLRATRRDRTSTRLCAGWIRSIDLSILINLLRRSVNAAVLLEIQGGTLTWNALAEFTLKCVSLADKDKERQIKNGFGTFWARLADDFLSMKVVPNTTALSMGCELIRRIGDHCGY